MFVGKGEKMEEMERKETLKFLKSLNAEVLDGFNLSSCAEKMYDATKGRNTTFLPLAVKEVWFKKKYPLSRVEWKVTFPTDASMDVQENIQKLEVTARAIVSVDGVETEIGNAVAVMYADDEVVKTIPTEKGRRYDAMKAFCIGTARSKALYNAGFGREFYGEEDDLSLLLELEEEKKEKETTSAPAVLDAALDVISTTSEVSSFVPVIEESETLRMPTTFGGTEQPDDAPTEKPKRATKNGFQQTLDGYFEEVLGLVPDAAGEGLIPSGNVCMLDEVIEQKKISETAEGTVAEEAQKALGKCEKRLAEINTWITKRGAVKMDKLYRSEDRIPLTIDSLIEVAESKKGECSNSEDVLLADSEEDFFNMSSEEIDAFAKASDQEPDYLDFVPDDVDTVQTSLFTDFQDDTDYRRIRCSSDKGNFLGKTYGEIIEDNPDVLSYLLDDDTPDYEADAIIGLAKELADQNSRFEALYKSVCRKEKLRKEAFEGVGAFS